MLQISYETTELYCNCIGLLNNSFNELKIIKICSVHTEPSLWTCSICKKILKTPGGYKQHMEAHDPVKVAKWKHECHFCKKKFRLLSQMTTHMKRTETLILSY